MLLKIRRYVCLLLVVVLCLSGSIVANAEDTDYQHFTQGDPEWGDYTYGGGCTLRSTGCAITGITILMAMANKDLRNRATWNPKIAAQKFDFDGGNFYWGSTVNADPTFTIVGGGKQYQGSNLSAEESKSRVNELLGKGYYVLICTLGLYSDGTHYSPIVGKDGDTPVVWDVAGADGGLYKWDDWAGRGLTEIIAYQSSVQSVDKAFEQMGSGSSSFSEGEDLSDEEKEKIAFNIVLENDLTGMPASNLIYKDQETINLVDRASLSDSESEAVEGLKEDMKTNKKFTFEGLLNNIISFVGMFFIMYGVALVLAYIFDYVNTFVDISVLGIISLNKFRVMFCEDERDERFGGFNAEDNHTYLTKGMLIQRVVVFECIGLFLVSGLIGNALSSFYLFIVNLFGR